MWIGRIIMAFIWESYGKPSSVCDIIMWDCCRGNVKDLITLGSKRVKLNQDVSAQLTAYQSALILSLFRFNEGRRATCFSSLENEQDPDTNLFEGDIILDPIHRMEIELGMPIGSLEASHARGAFKSRRWPNGQIPYTFDDSLGTFCLAQASRYDIHKDREVEDAVP